MSRAKPWARAPEGVRTALGRAEDMPFAAASFDAAIYVAFLQFIANVEKAVHRTRRVLRTHGKLLAMLRTPASQFMQAKLRDPNSYLRHIRRIDLKAIENAIASDFIVQTKYRLGIQGETIFPSRDPREAALYILRGYKKTAAGTKSPLRIAGLSRGVSKLPKPGEIAVKVDQVFPGWKKA